MVVEYPVLCRPNRKLPTNPSDNIIANSENRELEAKYFGQDRKIFFVNTPQVNYAR